MKIVSLQDFLTPVIHQNVEDIVFRGNENGSSFDIGFLPEAEFIYHFDISPDVFFKNLNTIEVYYEPYRTFLRLESPTDIQIYYSGKSDKLYVEGK